MGRILWTDGIEVSPVKSTFHIYDGNLDHSGLNLSRYNLKMNGTCHNVFSPQITLSTQYKYEAELMELSLILKQAGENKDIETEEKHT